MPKRRMGLLLWILGGLWVSLGVASEPAEAAVATISGTVLQVTHRVGASGSWQKSKVGATLPAGSRVRTGKRSACEIKFPDGSRVRMGPRSDLVITDPAGKQVKVVAGQVFANIVRGSGGAQIQGARATASVKGTWVLFLGPTMEGDYPARDFDSMAAWEGELEVTTPEGTENLAPGQQSVAREGEPPAPATAARPWAFGDGALYPWWWGLQSGIGSVATPGGPAGAEMKNAQTSERTQATAFVQGPLNRGDLDVVVQQAGAGPVSLASPWSAANLLALGALGQTQQQGRLGKRFFVAPGELDLAALLVTGGSVASAWGRAAGVRGNLYGEIGLQAFTEFSGWVDTAVSDLFLVYRQGQTDWIVGRQRYLEGPVNNSAQGSLFHSAHFDGASVHHTTPRLKATAAWVNEVDTGMAEPGRTGGWLGRLSTPVAGGTLGVNLVNWRSEGWGWSGDLSLPVWPRKLDLYAEVGEDPQSRTLRTFGAYFPGLYQSAGVDLFVEYATRKGTEDAWSAVAYVEAKPGWTGIAAARQTEEDKWEYAVGAVMRIGSLAF
jgi:hypothetical protein